MAIKAMWYAKGLSGLIGGLTLAETKKTDWMSDTIKIMLVTNASNALSAQETAAVKGDITGEVSATGYTAGGKALTTSAPTIDTTNNIITLNASDLSWTGLSAGLTCRYAVIYNDTDSTDCLLGLIDFGTDVNDVGGTFGITFTGIGVLQMKYNVP